MDKNRNYIYIIITGLLIALFIVSYFIFDNNKSWKSEELDDRVAEYNKKMEGKKSNAKDTEVRIGNVLVKTPGIACWGDGRTYGTNNSKKSYPDVIKKLLDEKGYYYPVANLGIYGEDSLTVLGRSGAIPFVIGEDFTVTGTENDFVEISIESENGEEVNPCVQEFNPGVNPCIVGGVKCIIYCEPDEENENKAKAYYFSRQDKSSSPFSVEKGTKIETVGSTKYKNYVNILQIGDGGGYEDDDALVEQNKRFVESLEGSEKYILIGRIGGSRTDNEYYDEKMEEEFGDNYLNIRELICQKEFEGVTYTNEDKAEMKEGRIPQCLKIEGYMNNEGNEIIGKLVYERLEELGIIEK